MPNFIVNITYMCYNLGMILGMRRSTYMGAYSVPESIRQLKPKGTMVKNISGHYYVYEYSNYTDENGKRHTKMGRSIGSIKEGIGFIPNNTFDSDS